MATKKRSTTMNRGADDERAAMKKYLTTRLKYWKGFPSVAYESVAYELKRALRWLNLRAARTAAKPGGLGKR